MQVTLTGDFNPWVELFAHAVEPQAREGLKKIWQLLALRDGMVADLRAKHVRGSAIGIAEILIGYPVIDVRTASKLIHKSFEAANQAIGVLVELGIPSGNNRAKPISIVRLSRGGNGDHPMDKLKRANLKAPVPG